MHRLTKGIRLTLAGSLLIVSAMCAKSAHATTIDFDITWSGAYGSGTAVLTTTAEGGGEYAVTGITGEQGGHAITGLSPYASADQDVFDPGTPALDFSGLSFAIGTTDYNLFNGDGNTNVSPSLQNSYDECDSAVTTCSDYSTDDSAKALTSFTITKVPTSVPEPSTVALLLTGLLSFGVVGWLRKQSNPSVSSI